MIHNLFNTVKEKIMYQVLLKIAVRINQLLGRYVFKNPSISTEQEF